MRKSLFYKYTVNNVPLFLLPLFYLVSYLVAISLFLYAFIVHFTCKTEILGRGHLGGRQNYIFCHWHTFIPLYYCAFYPHFHRHVWMQHPLWYMKPIHLILHFAGIKKIILGSSGFSGRKAADELVESLKEGYSTVILPDGPNGPPFVPKLGAFHISLKSKVPIVPIKFDGSKFFEGGSWDRKKWPIPFSLIRVELGNPIQVTEESFDEDIVGVTKALGK
jgi:lysophospholipid acyltransferase (LPLAT)-like uncharacterized protein